MMLVINVEKEMVEFETKLRTMSWEALHSLLRGLRTSQDEYEQRLVACLMVLEKTEYWLTEANPHPTFASFLAEYCYMSNERYQDLVKGVNTHSWAVASTIGMKATRQLVGVQDKEKAEAVKATMIETAQRTGMPLSDRNARTIVDRITGGKTRKEQEETRIAQLESECATLRTRVRKLERENKKLAAELTRRGGDPGAVTRTVLTPKGRGPSGPQPSV